MPHKVDNQTFLGWEDYWSVAVRRRWWIFLPLFVCWISVWGISWLLPSTYESEALILVEQQKVPDQYVVPNTTVSLQDRLQSITQQVLSRTRLQATIDRFHLYSPAQGLGHLMKPKDPVDQMRNDIRVELVRAPGHPDEFTAFKMHYLAGTAELAQVVNTELTSLFVNENVEAQQQLSEDTTAFLANELGEARVKMEKQEAKVAAFKTKHLGDLPSQLEGNVQILAGLQAQLQNTQQALDAARQHDLYSESLLQQFQSMRANPDDGPSAVQPMQPVDKELMDERLRLQDLKSRYTDDYPDIIALKEQIAETESLKKAANDQTPPAQMSGKNVIADAPAAVSGTTQARSITTMQLQSQIKANQLEIQDHEQQARDIESQIAAYRARLNLTPETEQQLTAISRGYEESKSNYDSLLQKQMQSQLATSLEQRQKGEQFRIIDPPSLPKKPSAPNHFHLSLAGLGLGLALGIAMAASLELTDVRIRGEEDLEGVIPARVLITIPQMRTLAEDNLREVVRWLEVGAAMVMVCLIAIGNLYSLYKG